MSHDISFQMEIFILLGYAQIAATLSGFIGVVFVAGERSQGQASAHDASAVFHFMFAGLGALFLSLLAALVLVCFSDHENFAWRLLNGVSGAMHLFGGGRLAMETRRAETGLRSARVMSGIGLAMGLVSWVCAAGYLPRIEHFMFLLATLWTLGVTVIAFISLLMTARDR